MYSTRLCRCYHNIRLMPLCTSASLPPLRSDATALACILTLSPASCIQSRPLPSWSSPSASTAHPCAPPSYSYWFPSRQFCPASLFVLLVPSPTRRHHTHTHTPARMWSATATMNEFWDDASTGNLLQRMIRGSTCNRERAQQQYSSDVTTHLLQSGPGHPRAA